MYNEIRVVYKGVSTPLYLKTNKNINNENLKLLRYDDSNDEWIDLGVTFDNVVDNIYQADYIFNDLGIILLKVTYEDVEIANSILNVKEDILSKLYNHTFGNWEIKNNKMYFYDINGDIIASYNLYDKAGLPTEVAVVKREKI